MRYDKFVTDQSVGSSVASVNTRNICFSPDHHTLYPKIDFPEEFRIDTKPFVNRPFFVENFTWSNQTQYTILTLNTRRLPRDVFTSNLSIENAMKLGAYFRSDLSLNISVGGTITHSGTLLIGILPPMPTAIPSNKFLVNTLLTGPHCFLHANEATSAVLHVPWFCNFDVASLDMRALAPATTFPLQESDVPGNFATLVVMVLNPLKPSDGSSTSLNLTIEATFNALDIFVPSPKYLAFTTQGISEIVDDTVFAIERLNKSDNNFCVQGLQSIASAAIDATTSYTKEVIGDAIDVVRAGIKYYTGLHNPNIPLISNRMAVTKRNFSNNTTGEQFFEKLDPYPEIDRIVDRPIFNTAVDEMSIKHILSKPQYIGTFRVNALDAVGKLLWARPISPRQGGLDSTSYTIANNIELLYYLSRAWRGSINIHVQSVMNNKQQIKLRLIQLYNPPVQASTAYPVYSSVLNAPSHLMEFTAGGQVQTFNLPFLCRNQLAPCSLDLSFDSLFHGNYYVYVAQALANSSGSPVDVNFNMYISCGDDFSYHGYSTEVAKQIPFIPVTRKRSDVGLNERKKKDASVLKGIYDPEEALITSDKFVTQGLEVMNSPQMNTELESYSNSINRSTEHQERLVSPVDIRPIMRRMYQTMTLDLVAGANLINLDEIVGERTISNVGKTPMFMVSSMYYGSSVGVKMKIKTYGSSDITVMFVPPQFNAQTDGALIRGSKLDAFSSFSPTANGGAGFALPFIEMAADSHTGKLYEFVVPNTHFCKFLGGPEKYANATVVLGTATYGSVLIWSSAAVKATLFAGFTDESRLGFHSVAPIFKPISDDIASFSIYRGSLGQSPSGPVALATNNFLYYTRV